MTTISLAAIEETGKDETVSCVVHGPGGIGKSTFAKDAPSTIFIDVENSTREIKGAKKFPVPEVWTWQYIVSCVGWLQKNQHPFKTVAFDTVDVMESLAWAELIRTKPTVSSGKTVVTCKSIDEYPFSTGYTMVLDHWRSLLSQLEQLRSSKGMNVVMLAHSAPRMVENPEGDNYEQMDLKANKHLAGLLCEWADSVLFASSSLVVQKDNKFSKGKGIGDGTRILRTEGRPAFRAKNRYSLPFELPLSWDAFYSHARGDLRLTPESVVERIRVAYESTPLKSKALAGADKYKTDVRKLLTFENWLKSEFAKLPQPKKEEIEL